MRQARGLVTVGCRCVHLRHRLRLRCRFLILGTRRRVMRQARGLVTVGCRCVHLRTRLRLRCRFLILGTRRRVMRQARGLITVVCLRQVFAHKAKKLNHRRLPVLLVHVAPRCIRCATGSLSLAAKRSSATLVSGHFRRHCLCERVARPLLCVLEVLLRTRTFRRTLLVRVVEARAALTTIHVSVLITTTPINEKDHRLGFRPIRHHSVHHPVIHVPRAVLARARHEGRHVRAARCCHHTRDAKRRRPILVWQYQFHWDLVHANRVITPHANLDRHRLAEDTRLLCGDRRWCVLASLSAPRAADGVIHLR
ncbi:hypothetical protein, conserved in T. vivax [Trypanosoma vivax Y486]|uniref:Uncharacterized protein n=1 Tax=Trypanosoma vivax (strain Y486) TaxID=1055687 RepID=F9WUK2_TRYVY|nr:hypothetical protein, conserved in T. vivax [Trypanosoma vivax Y486]|eukprot:CCD21251.1 hypothetical protein, conserved in T. vivax [Trypanosoma vivax Y486]